MITKMLAVSHRLRRFGMTRPYKKNKAARQIQTVEMALSEAAAPQKLFFQHLAVIPRSEATRDLPQPQHLAVIPRSEATRDLPRPQHLAVNPRNPPAGG